LSSSKVSAACKCESKKIPAQRERLADRFLPGRFIAESSDSFITSPRDFGGVAIFDLHALAVVREHDEESFRRAAALAIP
jgi:hypothetical protein